MTTTPSELRRLAEAATGSRWVADGKAVYALNAGGKRTKCVAQCRSKYHPPFQDVANAAYIAALSPDVCIKLLDRIERLEKALTELADLVDDAVSGQYTPDSFTTQPARAALEGK